MTNLESRTEPFDYNLSDGLILFKQLRHFPKIVAIDDPFIRYFEAGVNGILTGVQLLMYGSIYGVFFN